MSSWSLTSEAIRQPLLRLLRCSPANCPFPHRQMRGCRGSVIPLDGPVLIARRRPGWRRRLGVRGRVTVWVRPTTPRASSAHDPDSDAERAVDDDSGRLAKLTGLEMLTAGQGHPGDHVVVARSRLNALDESVDGSSV